MIVPMEDRIIYANQYDQSELIRIHVDLIYPNGITNMGVFFGNLIILKFFASFTSYFIINPRKSEIESSFYYYYYYQCHTNENGLFFHFGC